MNKEIDVNVLLAAEATAQQFEEATQTALDVKEFAQDGVGKCLTCLIINGNTELHTIEACPQFRGRCLKCASVVKPNENHSARTCTMIPKNLKSVCFKCHLPNWICEVRLHEEGEFGGDCPYREFHSVVMLLWEKGKERLEVPDSCTTKPKFHNHLWNEKDGNMVPKGANI